MDVMLPLFVGVPLTVVAIAAMVPWRSVRDALALLTPIGTAIAGVFLFQHVATHGTIAHAVGLYEGAVAIPFVADAFSAVMIVATSIVAFCANWFAIVAGETRARFYSALSLMLLTGVMGALLTGDLFNFFVFIEVMLLPSYGLLAMTGTWARLSAGRTFVLVNLATSTLLLIGVAVLYGTFGAVNLGALTGAGVTGGRPTQIALGIVLVALAVKAGLFPVHTWLPRTYPSTSASVMALFSGLHTKVAIYMIFRIYAVVFDLDPRWSWLIITISLVTMIVGAFAGLGENSMRRVLAYQMVGGMPFILVMLAFSSGNEVAALAAGILYMLHHMITLGALILTTGAIEETYGTDLLSKLSGIAKRDRWVAAIFAAGAFSVVGFPPFSGMWGKVFVVLGIAQAGTWQAWLVITVVVLASFGAFLAMMRLWREVFWGPGMNPQRIPSSMRVPWWRIAPGAVMVLMSFAMFILAGPLLDTVRTAAEGLVDGNSYQEAVLHNPSAGAVEGGH
ncbi:monovalent cation/H+ antiporter subunit D family protein [Corynebacterium kozikiae]|uniref:monovalent cation/H+ antiporter subunit D family protein n=1 Tax=Corynebacterium kozikiae TaxID=2968469 RepID=UPI00211BF67D|nr:monovalent cation/H+ antiporter subunit D family protein [Corynebacterium sp. 76QC2CO]MCQ9342746.1 monovalent cation/H+ antiporter subunit D family protein [Corynebacterium sp. 76QC2CO]